MLITIIIPCYNEKLTIEKVIDLILSQDKINKQIILVDDCSNDGTTQIIREKIINNIDYVIFHNKKKLIIIIHQYLTNLLQLYEENYRIGQKNY